MQKSQANWGMAGWEKSKTLRLLERLTEENFELGNEVTSSLKKL
jgi:NTP pyrophosphatase (non-canonical NTP hydrolase)